MDEVFSTQSNIYFDQIDSLTAETAANIFTNYSGAGHTLVHHDGGNSKHFFMTGNPFKNYTNSYLEKGYAGSIAERRLLSEIYMSRNSLGIMSFSSGRTYEKTIHLPAVRRLLEAQGYEADEISSMIDYMKKSFSFDASPELKRAFDEMDSIYDTYGGLKRGDLRYLSVRLSRERLKVLAPNMTPEQLQKLGGQQYIDKQLPAYQYKFVFSETEAAARKPIRRIFRRPSQRRCSDVPTRPRS